MKVIKKSGFAKKAAAFTLSAAMITSAFSGLSAVNFEQSKVEAAAIVDNGLRPSSQEGVILHCWNWSYSNIKKYMKDIAASGYTSIQTSPVWRVQSLCLPVSSSHSLQLLPLRLTRTLRLYLWFGAISVSWYLICSSWSVPSKWQTVL